MTHLMLSKGILQPSRQSHSAMTMCHPQEDTCQAPLVSPYLPKDIARSHGIPLVVRGRVLSVKLVKCMYAVPGAALAGGCAHASPYKQRRTVDPQHHCRVHSQQPNCMQLNCYMCTLRALTSTHLDKSTVTDETDH